MPNSRDSNLQPLIAVLERRSVDTDDNPLDEIAQLGNVVFYDRTSPTEIVAHAAKAAVIVINKAPINREILEQLPNLQLVCVTATGYDCVNVSAARSARVTVCNVPEYSTEAVAEHVFAMLLAHFRAPERHDSLIRDGQWQRHGEFCFWQTPQQEIQGLTLGVVGWGKIGQRVAEIANVLGMKLLVHTRTVPSNPRPPARFVDLSTLFEMSDIISLHCPLTEKTRHLVNGQLLSATKSTAILINTARGGLIDESALATALYDGRLAAALLDTVTTEPIPTDHPLLYAPNCLLTPHLAWATLKSRRCVVVETAKNIRAYLAGAPRNVVT